jgi:hypothetical protein
MTAARPKPQVTGPDEFSTPAPSRQRRRHAELPARRRRSGWIRATAVVVVLAFGLLPIASLKRVRSRSGDRGDLRLVGIVNLLQEQGATVSPQLGT